MEKFNSTLTLDCFQNLNNTPDNRKEFLSYSVDELKAIQTTAVKDGSFEVAAFIRDVLKDKENPNLLESVKQVEDVVQRSIVDTLSLNDGQAVEHKETEWWHEYLDLWNKQVETAKKLDEYYEKNNLKDEYDKFDPRCISFDGDTIIDNHVWNVKFIKENNWEYSEIPLLRDKLLQNSAIRGIHKFWDYYMIDIVQLNDNGWVKSEDDTRRFVVDGNWELLPQLWIQTWKDQFRKDSFWKYEYVKNLEDNKVKICLYNENMEKIAEREDKKEFSERLYSIQDFVDDMCVCHKRVDGVRPVYTIFDKNWVVAEWTEKELSDCEAAKKFFEQKEQNDRKFKENNEKWHNLPESQKDLQRYWCMLNKDDNWWYILENEKWEKIFEFDIDDYKVYKESYGFKLYSENWKWRFEISKWVNSILVRKFEWNIEKDFVLNLNTWDMKEFWASFYNGFEWCLFEHFINQNNAEIYDKNFNFLWKEVWNNKDLCFIANSENEYWEIKYYVYSKETWKKLTEYKAYWDHWPSRAIKNSYKDGDKTYYIIEQPDWNLVQVEV